MFGKLNHLLKLCTVALATASFASAARGEGESAPSAAERRPIERPQQSPGSLFTGPSRMEPVPDSLKNVTIDEHPKAQLPMDAMFTDDAGKSVRLGDYFASGKPVILQLGYYGCPMLCDLVSQGTVNALRNVPLEAGRDFQVVFVSIDPAEGREMAYKKKNSFLRAYGRGSPDGWHLLVGREQPIAELAKAVGFNYKWVATAGQFSHPAAIVICTPDGKVSQYMYGVQFKSDAINSAIAGAAQLKFIESVDRYVMTCLQYDGAQGKHAGAAMIMMRTGGVITVIVLASILWMLFSRERARARREAAENGLTATLLRQSQPGQIKPG